MNPHLMPSKFAKTAEQMQQEYNVKYVAITRAMRELHYIDSAYLV
jgi:superfamily I DNA/RNA helicase